MLQEKGPEKQTWFANDSQFDKLYPAHIQEIAATHWTPLAVAKAVAEFLAAERNVSVLDIGSGVGKFCLIAAHEKPLATFFGIEQRKDLVEIADNCKALLQLSNVQFIHGNFTSLDLRKFDHFYFYNPFYENLAGTKRIDDSVEYSMSLFHYYNHFFFKILENKPAGTRVATFHSLEEEMPPSYYVVNTQFDSLLKFWIKV